MKKIIVMLAVLIMSAPSLFAVNATPMYEESTNTVINSLNSMTNIGGDALIGTTDGSWIFQYNTATGTESFLVMASASTNADDDAKSFLITGINATNQTISLLRILSVFDDIDTGTEDSSAYFSTIVAGSAVTNLTLDSSGITVDGDVSATTLGGIAEASLVDKTAAETIAAIWQLTNNANVINAGTYSVGGVAGLSTNVVAVTNLSITVVSGIITAFTNN